LSLTASDPVIARENDMTKRILIATDGSDLSRRAAAAGVALAKSLGASVVGCAALRVYPYHGSAARSPRPKSRSRHRRLPRPTEPRRRRALGGRSRRRLHRVLREGNPDDIILQAARPKAATSS